MHKIAVNKPTYRLIPSHFPPIALFENLLDSSELEAAYALESLTNDRLQDQTGNIMLVPPQDRVTGNGTTAIMAAFTHIGIQSRFTQGHYGVYYAALNINTALAESKHSRARFMHATNEAPQILTMRCYECHINAPLIDLRNNLKVHNPNSFTYAQQLGEKLKHNNEYGVLYQSVRHPNGECIGALRPTALTPPAKQTSHYQYHWDGNKISHVCHIAEID